jgi:uncharacterized protein YggE
MEQKEISRTIIVNGKAEVIVVPDEINILLQVETGDKSLNRFKNDNDSVISKVISEAKKSNIDDKHIQTDYVGACHLYLIQLMLNKVAFHILIG